MNSGAEKSRVFVRLEEEDFLKLVSGKQVDKTDREGNRVHIILADIGWDRLIANIRSAMENQGE